MKYLITSDEDMCSDFTNDGKELKLKLISVTKHTVLIILAAGSARYEFQYDKIDGAHQLGGATDVPVKTPFTIVLSDRSSVRLACLRRIQSKISY